MIELGGLESSGVRKRAAGRRGHVLGRPQLRRAAQSTNELSAAVVDDRVVQTSELLGGQHQAKAVLAALGGQAERALPAGGGLARRREQLSLIHDEQAAQ